MQIYILELVSEIFFSLTFLFIPHFRYVFDRYGPGMWRKKIPLPRIPESHPRLETDAGQNLSFILEGIHKVTFEDRPVPELKDPHDVLINVKYTGICGSDVSCLNVAG